MKKLSFALLSLLAIPFFGCADDDDDSGASTCTVEKTTCTKASDCRSCECGDEAGSGAVCTEQGVCSCGSCRVAKPGELVINEVKIKKPEFIEIVNTTSESLGLGGLTITSYTNNGGTKDVKLKTGCLGPKGAVAITSQGEAEAVDPDAGVAAKDAPNPWIWSRSGKALKSEEDGTTKLGFVDSPSSETVKFLLSGRDGTVISSFEGAKALFSGSSATRNPDLGNLVSRHADVSPTGSISSPAKCMNGGEFEDGCVEPKCETDANCQCDDSKKYGCCDKETHTCFCSKSESCTKEEIVTGCGDLPADAVPVSAAGQIVINELRAKAPEFIELVNTTDHRVALKGLTFYSSDKQGNLAKRKTLSDGWLDAHEAVAIFSGKDWAWSKAGVCSSDEQKHISLGFLDSFDTYVSEVTVQLRIDNGSDEGLVVDEMKISKGLYLDNNASVTRSPDVTGNEFKRSDSVLHCKYMTPGTCSNGQAFSLGCNTSPAKDPCVCEADSECLDSICTGKMTRNLCNAGTHACECVECVEANDCKCGATEGKPYCRDHVCSCECDTAEDCKCNAGSPVCESDLRACACQCANNDECLDPDCKNNKTPRNMCVLEIQRCECVACLENSDCHCDKGSPICSNGECGCSCSSAQDCECSKEGEYPCCSDSGLCFCAANAECDVCTAPVSAGDVSSSKEIVINEVNAQSPEFIELVNNSNRDLSLKGLVLLSSKGNGDLTKRLTFKEGWLKAGAAVAIYSKSDRSDWIWSGEGCSVQEAEGVNLGLINSVNADQARLELRMGGEQGELIDEWAISKEMYNNASSSVTRSPDRTGNARLSTDIFSCLTSTPALCSTQETFASGCEATGIDPCTCDNDNDCSLNCSDLLKPANACIGEICECVACATDNDCAATCGDQMPSCNENQCECSCRSAEQCSCEDGKTPVCNGGECSCVCNQASQCSCDNGLTPVCNGGECGCACDSVEQCSCEEDYETPVCNGDGTCGCTSSCTPPTMGGDLTINEISVKMTALGKAEDEWVELVNTSGHDLLLKGIKLYGNTSSTTQVSQNTDLDLRFELSKGCIGRGQAFVVRRGVGIEINGEVITDIQSATTSTMKSLTNSGYLTFKLNYEPASGTGERLLDFVSYDGQPSADTSLGRFPDITGDLKPHSEGSGGVKHSRGFCNGTRNEFPSCLNFIK